MIEQFWMAGTLTAESKVIHRANDPRAEQMMPHAVGHHAVCQRMIRMRQPVRELQSSTVIGGDHYRVGDFNDTREAARHRLAGPTNLTTFQE